MEKIKIYKQTEEHRRKISEAHKGKGCPHSEATKKQISESMIKLLSDKNVCKKLRIDGRMKRKEKLGYINSPEARIKVSKSVSKMWKEGKATDKQKATLFKKGNDDRRTDTQFQDGHEVSEKTRNAVKENRKTQIFPKVDSSIEVKIQNFLKLLNIEFITHQYMKDIEHGYQCDVLIPVQEGINRKTIIECFGNYWHAYPTGREIDTLRCKELIKAGWRVLVFWENEIRVMELNELLERIK